MTGLFADRRRAGDRRGQILIIFAFGLIVFIGFAALAVDIGSLYVARRDYQNVSDAAALAGASYLTRPINDACVDGSGTTTKPQCARRAAWDYINEHLALGLTGPQIDTLGNSDTPAAGQAQTPTSGGAPYSIWVSTPPSGAGNVTYPADRVSTVQSSQQVIFVRIDRQRDVFFGKIFVPQGFTVSAWSTAGIFPNRYAVITLRRGRGNTEIDPGPANTTDIKLAGTNSTLNVVNGDVGGNWGMKLTSGAILRIYATGGDTASVYLIDYVSCGNSCWSTGQVVDNTGAQQAVKKLPGFVPDPNYPTPPFNAGATWPVGPVDNSSPFLDIPKSPSTPTTGPDRNDVNVKNSDPGSVSGGTCSSNSPVVGPGWYDDITVANGHCLVLSGNRQRTDMFNAATESDVPLTQQPGIIYVTGKINIGNDALIEGDGVTVVIRPTTTSGQYSPNSGGAMDLNRGLANGGTPLKLGGWTTKGFSSYTPSGGKWAYNSSMQNNAQQYGVGMAVYVLKPTQAGITANGGTNVIQVSSGAALAWTGVTYAPHDNVQIAGQPQHDGIGQLVSWTFTFNGGTAVTQTYEGPGDGTPYLIEPCVLVGGACQ